MSGAHAQGCRVTCARLYLYGVPTHLDDSVLLKSNRSDIKCFTVGGEREAPRLTSADKFRAHRKKKNEGMNVNVGTELPLCINQKSRVELLLKN